MSINFLIAGFPGAELLDIAGPTSVLANAQQLAPRTAGYRVLLGAMQRGPLPTSSGLTLEATHALARTPPRLHTLLIPGGPGTEAACADRAYIAAIKRLAARAQRVTSVCSGSFVLARAGLLDGLRATTHWRYAGQLARLYPKVRVEPDSIFIEHGKFWTSAGVTAGLDLALALVERDVGRELALQVARALVFYLKRPGGQSQFSAPLALQSTDVPAIERVRREVLAQPPGRLRVDVLAQRAHVSERHLRRLFKRDLQLSPRQFVQRVRLEQAQRLLCDSDRSVREVARRCGYASAESFTRRFEAQFGVSPSSFRSRFQFSTGRTP